MKVTPVKKKFGKYAVGDVFDLKDKQAKLLVKVGILREVVERSAPVYQTRMMQAEPAVTQPAPYGYKADGTPRLRPGRPAKSGE